MDIILHVGAHRTGTTSFQNYLRAHRDSLDATGIGFWGPRRTRKGLFYGLLDRPETPADIAAAARARHRVALNIALSRQSGLRNLVISDENMLGTMRRSIRDGRLYSDAGERLARIDAALGGVTRVVLQVRSLDIWWASALAFLVQRCGRIPSNAALARIAESARSWKDVVADMACACPQSQIVVVPFERTIGRPSALLSIMTGIRDVPRAAQGEFWKNRSPDLAALRCALSEIGFGTRLPAGDGRWMPFAEHQAASLREAYADDLFWLRAGAGGLAILTEDDGARTHVQNARRPDNKRGRRHDRPARILAPDG